MFLNSNSRRINALTNRPVSSPGKVSEIPKRKVAASDHLVKSGATDDALQDPVLKASLLTQDTPHDIECARVRNCGLEINTFDHTENLKLKIWPF
jgi:hypothetical protein